MTSDQLLGGVMRHPSEASGAPLLKQQCQEVDLEEDITELIQQLDVVTTVGCIRQLIGLFDRVRDDRTLVLLTIPRTIAPEASRYRVQALERCRNLRVAGVHGPQPVVTVVVLGLVLLFDDFVVLVLLFDDFVVLVLVVGVVVLAVVGVVVLVVVVDGAL